MERRTVPELSADTIALEEQLIATPIGSVVSYGELSAKIGRDVQRVARGVLESARRRALRDHQVLFEPVVNVGLKRLDDLGKVGAAKATLPRMRSLVRRGLRKATSVENFDALPNQVKVEHNVTVAQLGMIAYATQPTTTRKLEGHVGDAVAPTAKLIDAIKETL